MIMHRGYKIQQQIYCLQITRAGVAVQGGLNRMSDGCGLWNTDKEMVSDAAYLLINSSLLL